VGGRGRGYRTGSALRSSKQAGSEGGCATAAGFWGATNPERKPGTTNIRRDMPTGGVEPHVERGTGRVRGRTCKAKSETKVSNEVKTQHKIHIKQNYLGGDYFSRANDDISENTTKRKPSQNKKPKDGNFHLGGTPAVTTRQQRTHIRWLELTATIRTTTEMVEFIENLRLERGWKWSTTMTNWGSIIGATRRAEIYGRRCRLPMGWEFEQAAKEYTRNVKKRANEQLPRYPKPLTPQHAHKAIKHMHCTRATSNWHCS
jgi:hypothetical protein